MSGIVIIITGVLLLIFSTAGVVIAEWLIHRKKKRIREQMYHIYE